MAAGRRWRASQARWSAVPVAATEALNCIRARRDGHRGVSSARRCRAAARAPAAGTCGAAAPAPGRRGRRRATRDRRRTARDRAPARRGGCPSRRGGARRADSGVRTAMAPILGAAGRPAAPPAAGRYHPWHGGLRLLSGPRFPEAAAGDGRADAGQPVAGLGRQRDQARGRHDGRGDQPRRTCRARPSSRRSRSARSWPPSSPRRSRWCARRARASPDAVARSPPRRSAPRGRRSRPRTSSARPAAMTSLNERKRKMNTIAAKPVANVSAPMAICWPTE